VLWSGEEWWGGGGGGWGSGGVRLLYKNAGVFVVPFRVKNKVPIRVSSFKISSARACAVPFRVLSGKNMTEDNVLI